MELLIEEYESLLAGRCRPESARRWSNEGRNVVEKNRYKWMSCWYGLAIGMLLMLAGPVAAGPPQPCPTSTSPPKPCHEIDFDDQAYPPGTQIDIEYQPLVTFWNTGACAPLPVIADWPYPNANSAGQVLQASSSNQAPCCITAEFTPAQNWVSLYVSYRSFEPNLPPCEITFTAHYNDGRPPASTSVTPISVIHPVYGYLTQWKCVSVFDPLGTGCHIERIEVCAQCSGEFAIDTLEFGRDGTEPEVWITNPDFVSCDGAMVLRGWSTDVDSCGFSDILRVQKDPASGNGACPTPPGTPGTWCDIMSMSFGRGTPGVVPGAVLYTTTPANFPAIDYPEGHYEVEITGTNDCGAQNNSQRRFCLDRNPPTATITCPDQRPPSNLMIVRGNLPICGFVTDFCGVGSWDLSLSDPPPPCVPFGQSTIIASGTGSPPTPLTTWNTFSAAECGPYTLDLIGTDLCGRSTWSQSVQVIVDNTWPVATIEALAPPCPPAPYLCFSNGVVVRGVAFDENILDWTLQVSIGGGDFQPLTGGTTSVGTPGNPDTLFIWDTCCDPAPPPPGDPNCSACCYTLKLTVRDKAEKCCPAEPDPHVTEDTQCGNLGQRGDYDGNGVVDFDDIGPFVWDLSHLCPCPCQPCADCPPGGTQEGEPCGSDTNGGCNMSVPAFEPIACGQTICGTSYWNGLWRDTDWYVINTITWETFTVTAEAEFDLQVLVIADPSLNCTNGTIVDYALSAACDTAALTTSPLPPGRYYVWVGPQFNWLRTVSCTNDCNRYWVTLNCVPSPAPGDDPSTFPEPTALDAMWNVHQGMPADVSTKAIR